MPKKNFTKIDQSNPLKRLAEANRTVEAVREYLQNDDPEGAAEMIKTFVKAKIKQRNKR